MTAAADTAYMARALQLAARGLWTTDPNPRVGCVLVKEGRVVGEGWHIQAGGPHAEIHALRAAGEQARGADCYVTLEPCCHYGRTPPCADALIQAGVRRVIVAMADPNPHVSGRGLAKLRHAGIIVETGLQQTQAEQLNPGFIQRMRGQRPWVRAKLAMSLDGRTAMASGESQWITGAAARRDGHGLRARASAVLTGAGTVLADNPSMNVRAEHLPQPYPEAMADIRQPARIVVDGGLRTSADAAWLRAPGRTWVVCAVDAPAQRAALEQAGATVWHIPASREGQYTRARNTGVVPGYARARNTGVAPGVDLAALLVRLAQQCEVNEVHLEAGAGLSGAMLQAGLIDELVIYTAPILLGHHAKGLFDLPGLDCLAQKIALEIQDVRAIGQDWRITAHVKRL